MNNIEKIRAKISMYDDEIIKILSKRMDCIDEIIEYKKENGMPILQPEYEGKKEIALCKKLKDNKYQDEIMNVFRYVVKNAKKYQAKNLFPYNIMLIGFMGCGKSTISRWLYYMIDIFYCYFLLFCSLLFMSSSKLSTYSIFSGFLLFT